MIRTVIALALLAGAANAEVGTDGPDLPYSCATVRLYAKMFTVSQLEAMRRAAGVAPLTAKQIRQAKACLKGK